MMMCHPMMNDDELGIETVFQIAIGKHFTVFPYAVFRVYVRPGIEVSGIYTRLPIAHHVIS